MTIRETTNQQAELEKTMFPDEEQLEAFHLTDTLRVVNIQQGAGGAIYPLEGGTTTGDQQNDLHLADVRLRPVVPHSSRFVYVQSSHSSFRCALLIRPSMSAVRIPRRRLPACLAVF